MDIITLITVNQLNNNKAESNIHPSLDIQCPILKIKQVRKG